MAGPLAGIGAAQQQIPLATPSQPTQAQQAIRPEDRQPQPNRVQPQGAPAAETQDSETGDQNTLQARADQFLSQTNDGSEQAQPQRGSVLDIAI